MELREELRGRALWLTIDRPAQRNALTLEVLQGLRDALSRADASKEVRALCLTGAGDKAFCSGMDLTAGSADGPAAYAALLADFAGLGKPVVACVNGAVMAGGIGLLASCDLAIAADDARFGTPEVDVGLFPYMAAMPLLRIVGRRAALELLFTARKIDAAEAVRIGLLNRAVLRDRLHLECESLLQTLAEKSPTALRMGRRALHATQDLPFAQQLRHMCEQLQLNAQSEDTAEGIAAFLEKRKPDFK
jgi:enoyl-CoA hydratase